MLDGLNGCLVNGASGRARRKRAFGVVVSTLGLDVNSTLYDRCGTIVCHPDGGFTGRGDGQCPDFFDSATGRTSSWPTR